MTVRHFVVGLGKTAAGLAMWSAVCFAQQQDLVVPGSSKPKEIQGRGNLPASRSDAETATEVMQRFTEADLKRVSPAVRDDLRKAIVDWQMSRDQKALDQLMRRASAAAAEVGYKSMTEIKSQDEKGKSTTGAVVKYQLTWDREQKKEPRTGKSPTTDKEELAVGSYYIWLERSAKKTSDEHARFDLVKKQESITIVEK